MEAGPILVGTGETGPFLAVPEKLVLSWLIWGSWSSALVVLEKARPKPGWSFPHGPVKADPFAVGPDEAGPFLADQGKLVLYTDF